jgi:acetolactate synthase-1/2/3 large subunit
MMAGAGVLSAKAWDDFKELVELLNCPALTSGAGHTALPDDHPNHLRASTPGHWAARREADVVITFGTCLGEIDLPFDKYWGDGEQKLIQVDIDPSNIGAHRQLYRGVVADAGAAIRRLVAALKEAGAAPADGSPAARYRALNREARSAMLAEIGAGFEDGKIHPVQSIQAISEVFPDDAINVADGGNTSLYNRVVRTFTTPRTQLGNFEFGHLGTGIPHAIGAKLAAPEKEVVCITGDGAAGFNIMELETAVREQVKITVVVHAEGSWSMEEMVHRSTEVAEDRFGCFLAPTRWDKIAEGVGCHSEYVDQVEDLAPAMRRAREAPQAALVCVKTDRAMNLEPPGSDVFGEVYTGVPDE